MTRFTAIPTVSVDGEPIAVIKARYLISESKLTAAIALLKSDRASPWESRREYFISLSYEKLSNTDSAIVYALQVFRLKPLYQPNVDKLIGMLENREDYEAAAGIIGDYLACYEAMGPALDAYLVRWGDPRPTYVARQADLQRKAAIRRMESFYIPAQYEFNQKNYQAAVVNYTKIIEREPGITEAWEKRAWCYYYLNEPGKCLADIDTLAARGGVSKGLEEVKKKVKR
jgi:tetratricopeptide (TPR) repeat protein